MPAGPRRGMEAHMEFHRFADYRGFEVRGAGVESNGGWRCGVCITQPSFATFTFSVIPLCESRIDALEQAHREGRRVINGERRHCSGLRAMPPLLEVVESAHGISPFTN